MMPAQHDRKHFLETIRGRMLAVRADDTRPFRNLIASVVLQAIRDVRAGRPCGDKCCPEEGWHSCAKMAWEWLHSLEARLIYLELDIDHELVLARLPGIVKRMRIPGRRIPCPYEKERVEDAHIYH